MKIDWFAVLRDVLVVSLLGTFGTLAVSFVLGGTTALTQFVVALLMLTTGFTISGSLKGAGRFKHLPIVALGVWLVTLVDSGLRSPERLPGILVVGTASVGVAMLAGGTLSLLIKRDAPASAPPPE